jgi:hypothetical protein
MLVPGGDRLGRPVGIGINTRPGEHNLLSGAIGVGQLVVEVHVGESHDFDSAVRAGPSDGSAANELERP